MNFNTESEDSILQVCSLKGVSLFEKSACYTLRDRNVTSLYTKIKNEIKLKNEMVTKVMQVRGSKVKGHTLLKEIQRMAAS